MDFTIVVWLFLVGFCVLGVGWFGVFCGFVFGLFGFFVGFFSLVCFLPLRPLKLGI